MAGYSLLFLPFIIAVFVIAIFAAIIYRNRVTQAERKGAIGEQMVANILKKLDPKKYKVINDVLLQNGNYTSQIDHVVVSDYGIFVIEMKNYSGWIYGDEKSQNWTQVFYKRKEKFLNPIIQNNGHVKALEKLLGDIGKLSFIPIVVFSTKATLKVNVQSIVVDTANLLKTIYQYKEPIYSDSIKEKIHLKILEANKNDRKTKQIHIKNIQEKRKTQQKQIEKNKCPKCGSELVVKNGKYGDFKACAGYPKCKFTLKV